MFFCLECHYIRWRSKLAFALVPVGVDPLVEPSLLELEVAIKILRDAVSAKITLRFQREAQILVRLRHVLASVPKLDTVK